MNNNPSEFGSLSITSPVAWKWRRIVEQYSARSLTKEEDVFPALQGVAKFMGKMCDYYAGLWNDDSLFVNLLWHGRYQAGIDYPSIVPCTAHGPKGRDYGRRPAVWRAPTWSWASITRPVAFTTPQNDSITILASITDIGTDPFEDPFGQLRSGWLQLKGRCVDARLKNRAPERGTRRMPAGLSVPSSKPKISSRNRFPCLQVLQAVKSSSDSAEQADVEEYGFKPDYNPDALFGSIFRLMEMLQIKMQSGSRYSNPRRGVMEDDYVYLVFVCKDETKQVYERIGFLRTQRRVRIDCFVNNGEETVLDVV